MLQHTFVSAKADGPDATLVKPSHWNAEHTWAGGADGNLLTRDSGGANGGSWVNYQPISLTNKTGGSLAAGDVAAADATNDLAVALDDTVGSFKKFYVARATISNTAVGLFAHSGPAVVKTQGAIARGEYVRKSATSKAVETTGVSLGVTGVPPAGSIGVALVAASGGFATIDLFGFTVSSVQLQLGQGRLAYTSTAQITFGPYNGTKLPVLTSGVMTVRDIGSGITSGDPSALTNYVNGVASQALAANTTYLVTVFDNAGVLTFDFLTTLTHAPDATTGVEIKNGDNTRTVVGMVRTSAVPGALTAAVGAGGNVNAGLHSYKVTFVVGANEYCVGTVSAQVNPGVASQISLTNIPVGPQPVTARKIYRTVAGDTGLWKLVATISDNTSTTLTDNTADGSLGANAPGAITFQYDNMLRGVLSYFNRRRIALIDAFTVNRSTTSNGAYVEINTEIRANFLTWVDEAVLASISGSVSGSSSSIGGLTAFSFDGSAPDTVAAQNLGTAGFFFPLGLTYYKNGLSEGFHYITLMGQSQGASTITWPAATALTVTVQG